MVCIFDVATNSFETASTGTVTRGGMFWGAATVGSKVVFAPYSANVVGIFDVAANSFKTVSTGTLTMDRIFWVRPLSVQKWFLHPVTPTWLVFSTLPQTASRRCPRGP